MTTENIATLDEIQEATLNMQTVNEEVKSTANTLVDQYGTTRKTMVGREAEFNTQIANHEAEFDVQLASQVDTFQNRFALSDTPIPWSDGLDIEDELQHYSTGTKGESGYSVWLPDPNQLPFTTGATFSSDVELGRWSEIKADSINAKEAIALILGVSVSDIILSTDTSTSLNDFGVIYDVNTAKAYINPAKSIELFDETIDPSLQSPIVVPDDLTQYEYITGLVNHPNIIVGNSYDLQVTLDKENAQGAVWFRHKYCGQTYNGGSSFSTTIIATADTCYTTNQRLDNGSAGVVISVSLKASDAGAITSIIDGVLTTSTGNAYTLEEIIEESATPTVYASVTDMQSQSNVSIGDRLETPNTEWEVTDEVTTLPIGSLYLKARGEIYLDDFKHTALTDGGALAKANDYAMSTQTQLVFTTDDVLTMGADDSFIVYVESAGWYCPGNCQLKWTTEPTAGYAVNVRGRRSTSNDYKDRVNYSNYIPLEGITIGKYLGWCLAGSGLQIGYADGRTSTSGLVVTSKFKLVRVNVFDFDDVIDFWNGSWAIELDQVNTMGGSWRTPDNYFTGLDFGENMKLSHCFVADNHARTDGEMGTVNLSVGEWTVFGGSFDNMHVIVGGTGGDANVKMTNPHFENPASTAKDKLFLSVTSKHASCVIDNPTIAIRDTPIYSALFYCLAGTDLDRFAYSGGLTLQNPQFNAVGNYRPDLALAKSITDAVDYHGYGFKELVGGGGRVKLVGQAFINSQFYTYKAIPIARNLIGASLNNTGFDIGTVGGLPNYWTVKTTAPHLGTAVLSNDFSWVGAQCLKTTAYYNGGETWHSTQVYQSIPCKAGNLAVCNMKTKWVIEDTASSGEPITGQIILTIKFYDREGNYLSTGWSTKYDVENANSTSDYDGWLDANLVGSAPDGTDEVRLVLESYSTSNADAKKIHAYYDGISMNVV